MTPAYVAEHMGAGTRVNFEDPKNLKQMPGILVVEVLRFQFRSAGIRLKTRSMQSERPENRQHMRFASKKLLTNLRRLT